MSSECDNPITITAILDAFSAMVSVFLLLNSINVYVLYSGHGAPLNTGENKITTCVLLLLLAFHSLWVQQVHFVQRIQCHRRVPEGRESASSNYIVALNKTFSVCSIYDMVLLQMPTLQ